MTPPTLSIDQFARSVAVNRNNPHALFLGAGASLTSGMPSAASCVCEWKRRIFVSNNPALKEYVAELSLPSVRGRIDGWLRANGHWPAEGMDDYGYYIERCPLLTVIVPASLMIGSGVQSRILAIASWHFLPMRSWYEAFGRRISMVWPQKPWASRRRHR